MNIAERNKIILAKLRSLPEKVKKIVLWTIIVVLAAVMGYFWVNSAIKSISHLAESAGSIKLPSVNTNMPDFFGTAASGSANSLSSQAADWQIYKNKSYDFQINYPADWNYREYDTGTGAAFFPKNKPNDEGGISIGFYKRGSNYCKIPFDDYVKIAGPSEIQNYESLNTINGGISNNGVGMYITTWNYNDFQGNGKISLPITYFDTSPDLCGDIEAMLNDNNYSDIYSAMISTFNFTK